MNDHNLHSNSERTPRKRQEIARKGGVASGRARREKKTRRELLLWLLEQPFKVEGVAVRSSITGEEQSIDEAMLAAQIKQALDGDTKAFNALLDVLGERVTKQEVSGSVTAQVVEKERPLDETLADIDRLGVLADIARKHTEQ